MATQEQKIIFRKMEEILYSYNKYVNKIKKSIKKEHKLKKCSILLITTQKRYGLTYAR